MSVAAFLAVLLPLAGTLVAAPFTRARPAGTALIVGSVGGFAAALIVALGAIGGTDVNLFSGYLYVDALGAFFLVTVEFIVLLAAFGSAAYLRAEEERGELQPFQVRLYFIAFGLFSAAMFATFETGNLGLLFVLIEASTLVSAVLVALEGRGPSLEAAWKYIIISSLGVTIALAGTLFVYYAASKLPGSPTEHLTWGFLFTHAGSLQATSTRLGFLLAVIGYGTKVGLAPMHTWLPDAHSEAPSPASAMLSAGLLNSGMYAIMRFRAIGAGILGAAYVDHVLLIFGFLSVAVGTLFIVLRGNFKRIFAYSSVEHMGIIAVALGFGGILGLYGALLHTINHAVGKAVVFLATGDIVLRYRTRLVADVRGALGAVPIAGAALMLGAVAVAGSPPFGLFLSEFTIIRAGFAGGLPILAGLLLLLVAIAFIALLAAIASMVFGVGPVRESPHSDRTSNMLAHLPLIAGLGVLLVLGLWIPGPLNSLLMASVKVMG
jgi:hydrogenase-4 component F